jgi:hypothetical protein
MDCRDLRAADPLIQWIDDLFIDEFQLIFIADTIQNLWATTTLTLLGGWYVGALPVTAGFCQLILGNKIQGTR